MSCNVHCKVTGSEKDKNILALLCGCTVKFCGNYHIKGQGWRVDFTDCPSYRRRISS